MALKDLILNRPSARRQSPEQVITNTLRRYGVPAPLSVTEGIMTSLRAEGYDFRAGPKPQPRPRWSTS